MQIILIIIISFLVVSLIHKYSPPRKTKKYPDQLSTQTSEPISDTELEQILRKFKEPEDQQENTEFTGRYQKRYLLTKNEWYEYRKLKQLAENKGLQVCPKVRMLDLIEPRRGDPKYRTLFYKIQAKHVDFVICDQNLYVKAIVELDDNSHNQADRKERDDFVDTILKDVGYTVIRTRSITENTLSVLDTQNQPKTAPAGQDHS